MYLVRAFYMDINSNGLSEWVDYGVSLKFKSFNKAKEYLDNLKTNTIVVNPDTFVTLDGYCFFSCIYKPKNLVYLYFIEEDN